MVNGKRQDETLQWLVRLSVRKRNRREIIHTGRFLCRRVSEDSRLFLYNSKKPYGGSKISKVNSG